jgi:hypothetical protein
MPSKLCEGEAAAQGIEPGALPTLAATSVRAGERIIRSVPLPQRVGDRQPEWFPVEIFQTRHPLTSG